MRRFIRVFTAKRPPYHFQGAALIPRKRFHHLKLLSWLYTFAWATAMVYVSVFATFPVVWRGAVWLLLVVGTPALGDLLMSYAAYEKSWRLGNPAAAPRNEQGDGDEHSRP